MVKGTLGAYLKDNFSAACISIGFMAGFFGGLVGIGGGLIMVPALVYFLAKNQHEAHGTSLFVIVFTASVGALSYAGFGHMNLDYAIWVAVGGISGAYLGSALALKLPEKTLRVLFGWLLVVVGIKMFW